MEIEIFEETGTFNLINEETKLINLDDKNDIKKVLETTHKLTPSEPRYGNLCFSGRDTGDLLYKVLPKDANITIIYNGTEYPAHTHRTLDGRIGRLAGFFREHKELDEKTIINVVYDVDNRILTIK